MGRCETTWKVPFGLLAFHGPTQNECVQANPRPKEPPILYASPNAEKSFVSISSHTLVPLLLFPSSRWTLTTQPSLAGSSGANYCNAISELFGQHRYSISCNSRRMHPRAEDLPRGPCRWQCWQKPTQLGKVEVDDSFVPPKPEYNHVPGELGHH